MKQKMINTGITIPEEIHLAVSQAAQSGKAMQMKGVSASSILCRCVEKALPEVCEELHLPAPIGAFLLAGQFGRYELAQLMETVFQNGLDTTFPPSHPPTT